MQRCPAIHARIETRRFCATVPRETAQLSIGHTFPCRCDIRAWSTRSPRCVRLTRAIEFRWVFGSVLTMDFVGNNGFGRVRLHGALTAKRGIPVDRREGCALGVGLSRRDAALRRDSERRSHDADLLRRSARQSHGVPTDMESRTPRSLAGGERMAHRYHRRHWPDRLRPSYASANDNVSTRFGDVSHGRQGVSLLRTQPAIRPFTRDQDLPLSGWPRAAARWLPYQPAMVDANSIPGPKCDAGPYQ